METGFAMKVMPTTTLMEMVSSMMKIQIRTTNTSVLIMMEIPVMIVQKVIIIHQMTAMIMMVTASVMQVIVMMIMTAARNVGIIVHDDAIV
jgi:hypothetical protein